MFGFKKQDWFEVVLVAELIVSGGKWAPSAAEKVVWVVEMIISATYVAVLVSETAVSAAETADSVAQAIISSH